MLGRSWPPERPIFRWIRAKLGVERRKGVTTLREHGAIVSAETLGRPRRAPPPAWHPVHQACVMRVMRDARTPLVVTPMQAVSAGPATCPEVGSCRSPRRRASDVPHAQANNDVGGDEGVRGRSEPAIRSVWQYIPFSTVTDEQPVARQLDHLFTWSPVLRSTLTRTAARREGRLLLCAPPTGSAGRFAIRGGLPNGSDVVVIRILAWPALALGVD